MSLTFEQCRQNFKDAGFLLTNNAVVLHHLRKDFVDFDVTRERFYILPVGESFLHVALIEHEYGTGQKAVQVRYCCAGDDLLYGLRTKFNSGGAINNEEDLAEIHGLIVKGDLHSHPRYIRKRFRHGRTQAKVRAVLIMALEKWKLLLSSIKFNPT